MNKHIWCALLLVLCTLPALAQTQVPARAAEEQQRNMVKDAVQGGWSVNDVEGTKFLFDETLGQQDLEVKTQLDRFRSERNNSLARNQGNIPPADKSRLDMLAGSLNSTAPHSFEGHLSNYYVQFPARTAFKELEQAALKGPGREELIAPALDNAARTGNTQEQVKWAKEMKNRGRVAPGLYAYAEDLLSSVAPNGVLFAAGEMDAYPLWVEQFASAMRKDVLVVDERLLADPDHRALIWKKANGKGSAPDRSAFIASLAKTSARPVFLSMALGGAKLTPLRDKLFVTGVALQLSDDTVDNLRTLEEHWGRFKKAMDAGPLSQNYLVAGAVLLKHYRSVGDETKASLLEHELRGMANALGATDELIKAGVLAH